MCLGLAGVGWRHWSAAKLVILCRVKGLAGRQAAKRGHVGLCVGQCGLGSTSVSAEEQGRLGSGLLMGFPAER